MPHSGLVYDCPETRLIAGWAPATRKEHPVKMNRASSRSSSRGNQVSAADQADLQHWSELAHKAATILLADPTIRELRCEWPTVEWVDMYGEVHEHRFDYFAVHHDNSESAFNVKYFDKEHEVAAVFKGIGAELGFRRVWVHEGIATDGRAANARSVLKARQNYNRVDYVEALTALVGTHGRVYLHQLLARARNEADRREAIYALIDSGVIDIVKPLERLADYSQVSVNPYFHAQELARHARAAA